jgi:membrane protease YdiL (CAAX protease family)
MKKISKVIDTSNTFPNPFNPWWAVILVLLVFNFLPLPFYLILESIGGDWLMQNPVEVEILSFPTPMYPVLDNLNSVIAAPLIVWFLYWRMQKRNLNLSRELGLQSVTAQIAGLSVILYGIFAVIEHFYGIYFDVQMPEAFIQFILSTPTWLALLSMVVAAPIMEEFIFRGFLFSQLRNTRLGGWGAIITTSFLWTVIHFQYETMILYVLFILGIFLGYLRYKYNSLYLVIGIHALNNMIPFIFGIE